VSGQGSFYKNASPESENTSLFTFQHGLLPRCAFVLDHIQTHTLTDTRTHMACHCLPLPLCLNRMASPYSSTRSALIEGLILTQIYQTTYRKTNVYLCALQTLTAGQLPQMQVRLLFIKVIYVHLSLCFRANDVH